MIGMIPRLVIKYSDIYDEAFHYYRNKKFKNSVRKMENYADTLQRKWNKVGTRIFRLISKKSGLKWKDSVMYAYVVRRIDWDFSEPLTINMNKDLDAVIEVLMHELCHCIIIQNYKHVHKREKKSKIWRRYSKEHQVVRAHILSEAIQFLVMKKFYGRKKAEEIIESYGKEGWKWHHRAFKIVEKEGAGRIIKELAR